MQSWEFWAVYIDGWFFLWICHWSPRRIDANLRQFLFVKLYIRTIFTSAWLYTEGEKRKILKFSSHFAASLLCFSLDLVPFISCCEPFWAKDLHFLISIFCHSKVLQFLPKKHLLKVSILAKSVKIALWNRLPQFLKSWEFEKWSEDN